MKFIIIGIIIFIIYLIIKKRTKKPKYNALITIDGSVKTGKTTLGVYIALKEIKKRQKQWKIKAFFQKLFKKEISEKPLLYSNIPIAYKHGYVELTKEILTRQKRINYGSVVFISEASLVSDSQDFKDQLRNEQQTLFYKLFGHETKGGLCIIDTQQIGDLHYSVKRAIGQYFYIHHNTKLPFFMILKVQENRYSEDGTTIVVEQKDTEEKLKSIIIPKSIWKKFDAFTYSKLTDNLPIEQRLIQPKDLKTNYIVSFRNFKTINEKYTNKEKNENEKK